MRDFPIVAKVVINIILYVVYVLLASVVFSFIFPLILQMFGSEVIDPRANMDLYDKIAIFIAILVLIVSLIFRKYFYISLKNDKEVIIEEKVSYTQKAKKAPAKTKKVVSKDVDDDEIKIYVEKEIK